MAIYECIDILYIILGIFEFELSRNIWQTTTGRPIQRSQMILQEWFFVKDKEKIEIFNFNFNVSNNPPTYKISRNKYNKIKKYFNIFIEKNDENSIESFIGNFFFNYLRALFLDERHNIFLVFWQLLEYITLSENGNTKEVIKRIKIILSKNNKYFDYDNILEAFAQKRNDIVHKGDVSCVDDDDINIIKDFIIIYMDFIILEYKKLKTKGMLRKYFEYNSRQSEFSEIKKIINYLDETNK